MNFHTIMASSRKIPVLFIVIICLVSICCVPAVTAWKVTKIQVDPEGPLAPGVPVIVTARIDFSPEDGVAFEPADELQFTTDLAHAKCYYDLVLNGVPIKRQGFWPGYLGPNSTLSGRTLSYPDDVKVELILTLEGMAPAVQHTTNRTMLKIDERDSRFFHTVKSYEYTSLIVNTSEIREIIERLEKRSEAFRSHIDEKAAMGVNTTPAEEKYLLAESYLRTPCCKPGDYTNWQQDLILCDTAITEGEALLDKAWAEKTVTDAEEQLEKANATIDAIHANLSTTFDKRLNQSYMKRDNALADIALARDNMQRGDFPQARVHAYSAAGVANMSYHEALDAQKRMEKPLNSIPLPVAVPVFAVLGACLVVIVLRRKTM